MNNGKNFQNPKRFEEYAVWTNKESLVDYRTFSCLVDTSFYAEADY